MPHTICYNTIVSAWLAFHSHGTALIFWLPMACMVTATTLSGVGTLMELLVQLLYVIGIWLYERAFIRSKGCPVGPVKINLRR